MRVVGVDPGGRDTGVVVIDWHPLEPGVPELIVSTTVTRPRGDTLTDVPRWYLHDVNAAILAGLNDYAAEGIGVEGVTKPKGHARGRKGHLIDPGGLIATAQVLGSILGRLWRVPVHRVDPRGNGQMFPLNRYPGRLGTAGKGNDKRRHERSAFDVAVMTAPEILRDRNLALARGEA